MGTQVNGQVRTTNPNPWPRCDSRENAMLRWPRRYSCRFIEPGLVAYSDYGTVLVQKPALDAMAKSFIGKPVINEVHKDVDPSVYEDGEADGIVSKVWFNQDDGWYWCEFLVWDPATQHNCESDSYSVSCAYTVSSSDPSGGSHNNVPYAQEVLGGEYTHLAIVLNPRYEGARIIYNSKGGSEPMLKFLRLFKGKKEALELKNAAGAVVEVDGVCVPVKEMLDLYNAQEQQRLANDGEKLSEDTIIEVDGKEMPLKNLVDCYRGVKNAEEADKKKKDDEKQNAEDVEKKKKEADEKKNAEDEEKKKKDEEEKRNAEESEKKKKEEEVKNAAGKQHFNSLKEAAAMRGNPQQPKIMTRREQAEVGASRYGSSK